MTLLSPEEQANQAKETYQRGDYLLAAQEFHAAVVAYQAQNNYLMAAEMRNNQSVALLQGGDAQNALDVLEGTEDTFQKGNDNLRLAMAYGNRASALEALKQNESALEFYIKSAEILKELGENDLFAQVMQSASALQLKSGKSMEALATMQSGVSAIKKPNFIQKVLKKLLRVPFKWLGG